MTLSLAERGAELEKEARSLRALKRAYGCTKGGYVEYIRNPLEKPSGLNDERFTTSFFLAYTTENDLTDLPEREKLTSAHEECPLYEGILETLEKKIHSHELIYNATLAEIKLELEKPRH